jgi:hypothetical protein
MLQTFTEVWGCYNINNSGSRSMAINLYLKYFHDGKGLDKMLEEIETENTSKEQGLVTADHIDNLRTIIRIFHIELI